MGRALRLVPLVLLAASVARGEERLAVFELFVRGAGAYCIAAAPSVTALQDEMAGRALLLEYPYDSFPQGRVDRFWAAYSGPSPYLPLVVVGSGYDVCQGPVDYASRYRQMIDAELARQPRAALRAYSRTWGAGLRVWGTLRNTGASVLSRGTTPAFWVVAWEDGRIGLTKTFVRATASAALGTDVPPGGTASVTIDIPSLGGADPGRTRSLLLLEDRPYDGRWDMLQARRRRRPVAGGLARLRDDAPGPRYRPPLRPRAGRRARDGPLRGLGPGDELLRVRRSGGLGARDDVASRPPRSGPCSRCVRQPLADRPRCREPRRRRRRRLTAVRPRRGDAHHSGDRDHGRRNA